MMRISALACLLLLSIGAHAAPGDTTYVQAHSDIWMDHHGNFDTAVEFPNGSVNYRKALMTFTLGKYQCPGNPQYCGDWDYTVHIYLMTKTGDTLELGRYITPYANATSPRTPWTWKQRYTFDVTDFYPLLKDSATVRINYSGYSWGFTANIRFALIEGTPPRNVLGIDRLWKGSYAYHTKNPIDNNVTTRSKTSPSGTQSAEMKFTISGHGNNNESCAEFCRKYYRVMLNGSQLYQRDIWRDDCGYNHMYPQSGTWVFNRGNWCPGDIVFTNNHPLTGVGSNTSYNIDVDFQAAQDSTAASYSIESHVVYYGAFNKNLDASLDDIVAPTDHEVHFRENPFNGRPVVTVTNTGATTITSLKFEYGITGKAMMQYTWNGSLASLQVMDIEMDILPQLQSANGKNEFTVKILEVNGQADDDATNNSMRSTFEAAPRWPADLRIEFITNKAAAGGVSETQWQIFNVATGSVVAQRINNPISSNLQDTLHLADGIYKLVVADAGCDGIRWWLYSQYPVNPGFGSIFVRNMSSIIPYALNGYFNGDFGCGFTQYFSVGYPAGVQEVSTQPAAMQVYPNPAQTQVSIGLEGVSVVRGTVYLVDMMGRVVVEKPCTTREMVLDISAIANGVYTVVYKDAGQGSAVLQHKLMITK